MVQPRCGEGQGCSQEERKALGQIVVPVILPIEDGQRLGKVEVQKPQGWKSPESVEEPICCSRHGQDSRTVGVLEVVAHLR